MPTYTQTNRSFALTTPLGPDALLLAKFSGREALNVPFSFQLDLLATSPISFDDIIQQPATVRITAPGSPTRFINGILCQIEEGDYQAGPDGPKTFIRYRAELVPAMWKLSLRTHSRIWKIQSVPQILKQILQDEWQLVVSNKLTGTYQQRDCCVQYQESDLAFVMRLMEDEGIWFAFDHSEKSHTLILGNSPAAHPQLQAPADLMYDPTQGTTRQQGRILSWTKRRRDGVSKVRVRDFNFEKPGSVLESIQTLKPVIEIGTSTQHFRTSDQTCLDEYPAGFARRFDRILPNGQDQPEQLDPLFTENQRVAELRVEAEAAKTLRVMGTSDCGHLVAGCVFNLTEHFSGNGAYALVSVEHSGDQLATFLQGETTQSYSNSFEALPLALPFRPQRVTPKPTIYGTQTAKVVGPAGAETYLDRYGRVKVKFVWELEEVSCWVRVAQIWAGKRWGAFFWPRVNHEVVVTFENGDPERPLITGSVYNDFNMPPFELPANAATAGIKSFSMSGDLEKPCDPMEKYNGIVFHDIAGDEHVELHSERNSYQNSEASHFHNINGVHRVNVSERQSMHIGNIPTSGSGTGESMTPSFIYAPQTDLGKMWGVNFTSVAGLNQTNTLGVYGALTVGDYINVVNNPIGLIADGCSMIDMPAKLDGLLASAGALFGGNINLLLGSNTGITYGRQISVARSGKAAISYSATYGGMGPALGALALVLVGLLSAVNTIGLVVADYDAYSTDYSSKGVETVSWEVLMGLSLLGMAVLVEVEIIAALLSQVQSAKDAAAATAKTEAAAKTATTTAATAQEALNLAKSLESLISAKENEQNVCRTVDGIIVDHSSSRTIGTSGVQYQYAGDPRAMCSSILMAPESLSLTVGSATGSAITLSEEEITLGFNDSKIRITREIIELRCGANILTLTSGAGIALVNGVKTISLNPETGIVLETAGGGIMITDAGLEVAGTFLSICSFTDLQIVTTGYSLDAATLTVNGAITSII
jgi:type VI secretion system secreted protein VgrG